MTTELLRRSFAPLLCLAVASPLCAQDWPHWRGPAYNGSTAAKGLPTDFSTSKHVRWKTALPGPAASTPIVVGKHVFLTAVDREQQQLLAMCVNFEDGSVVWKKDAGSGYSTGASKIARGRRSNYASPSPTTDGKTVVFFFGNGDLVAYDLEGEELWRRNVQKEYGDFAFQWTFSASPTFWGGKVFLPVLQRDTPVARRSNRRGSRRRGGQRGRRGRPQEASQGEERKPIESFLLALDPKTGKTLYKHVRPSPAKVESLESYATMIPQEIDGVMQMLVVGGDVLTGHEPDTGKELWRWGTWNEAHRERWWRVVPSVVVGGGVALVCAPKRAPVYAIKLGGKGNLGEDALAWQSKGRANPVSSDVPTPAFHDGFFYVLSDVRNGLSKVDAKTGEVSWSTPLSRDFPWRASPTVADGKVWFMNHGAEAVVVGAASGEILHTTPMGGEDENLTRSSVVVAHGSLMIRTNGFLYRIAKN